MTDRELLEAAAKAAGMHVLSEGADWPREKVGWFFCIRGGDEAPALFDRSSPARASWAPLNDDRDALRLAIDLQIQFGVVLEDSRGWTESSEKYIEFEWDMHAQSERYAATRRAITRAAAEIGKSMP